MAEWFKAAVLKTVERVSVPGVRIPLSPPQNHITCCFSRFILQTINFPRLFPYQRSYLSWALPSGFVQFNTDSTNS